MSYTNFKKKFSKDEFLKYDFPAREKAKEYFKKTFNVTLEDNTNIYDVDLIGDNGSRLEVEVRASWKNQFNWPYSDYTIPVRKLKYESFDIMTFNSSLTLAVYVTLETIFKYLNSKIKKKNRYTSETELEEFIQIPISEIKIIKFN